MFPFSLREGSWGYDGGFNEGERKGWIEGEGKRGYVEDVVVSCSVCTYALVAFSMAIED